MSYIRGNAETEEKMWHECVHTHKSALNHGTTSNNYLSCELKLSQLDPCPYLRLPTSVSLGRRADGSRREAQFAAPRRDSAEMSSHATDPIVIPTGYPLCGIFYFTFTDTLAIVTEQRDLPLIYRSCGGERSSLDELISSTIGPVDGKRSSGLPISSFDDLDNTELRFLFRIIIRLLAFRLFENTRVPHVSV